MQYSCVFLGRSFLYSFQLLILMESTWTVPTIWRTPTSGRYTKVP